MKSYVSISCFGTTFLFLPSLLEPTSLNLKSSTPDFISTSYQAKHLYDFCRILDFATIANVFPSLSDTLRGRAVILAYPSFNGLDPDTPTATAPYDRAFYMRIEHSGYKDEEYACSTFGIPSIIPHDTKRLQGCH